MRNAPLRNVTAPLLYVDSKELCSKSMHTNVSEECFPSEQILYAQEQGAVGFIVGRIANFGGLGSRYVSDSKPKSPFRIPAVEIDKSTRKTLEEIINRGSEELIVELSPEPNPYASLPWFLFPVVFLPLAAINLGMAIHKLIHFVAPEGKLPSFRNFLKTIRESLSVAILCDETLANLICFFWAIDGVNSTQLFNNASNQILMTLDLPFHLGAQVMIAYVWNQALNSMKKPGVDVLSKLRIPMCIFLVLVFAAASTNRAFKVSGPRVYAILSFVMYLALSIVISTKFIISGVRLIKMFNHSPAHSEGSRASNLKRMGKMIAIVAVTSDVEMVLVILLIVMEVSSNPIINSAISYFIIFFLIILALSFAIINVFSTPGATKEKSSSSEKPASNSQSVFASPEVEVKTQPV